MGDGWLPGWERPGSAATFEQYRRADLPARLVLHMTQGFSSNIAATASRHQNPPHLWVGLPSHPYQPRTKVQLGPLTKACRALARVNRVETNHAHAFQVEIEGYSENAFDLSDEDLAWIARELVVPCMEYGIQPVCRYAVGGDATEAAGANGRRRMTPDEWYSFGGVTMHQEVPTNDHWDCGRLRVGRILELVAGTPAPHQEDDMATYHDELWHDPRTGAVYLTQSVTNPDGGFSWLRHATWLADNEDVKFYREQAKLPYRDANPTELAAVVVGQSGRHFIEVP